ncbi:hypothetical protein BU23DRAFT_138393 [Bimuria novae-zelandiae CBS 107.79]|uniref:Uncharacterized protein n=1 Tax=Bimuria novae-zelandiae CBS 107.79 TaxID=1447943 RepID=A0A6A5VAR4_9PLEO|nr:hypothetical protein BU23DRAFT_138393 [Bimuria novae-zelandiae CBS 107.79]
MAPRRGSSGGGSSIGGSDGPSGCPGFLQGSRFSTPLAYYVNYALFLFLFICLIIAFCCLRAKVKQKKLTGPLFWLSVLCQIIGNVLLVVGVTLLECNVVFVGNYSYFQLAFNIFFGLGNYLLLVIVVWGLNTLLIGRLNSGKSVVQILTLAITGVMGVLTAAYIGLSCYMAWSRTDAGLASLESSEASDRFYSITMSYQKYAVAYWALYLLSVIAAGGLAIATITRMRSRNILTGDILIWTVALFLSMLLWVIFQLIPYAATLDPINSSNITENTWVAISYLNSIFQLFSYIFLIFLSTSRAWEHANAVQTAYNNTASGMPVYAPVQQQYAYNGQTAQQQYTYSGQPAQQYYYQQQPVYNSVPAPVQANGHMVQVK